MAQVGASRRGIVGTIAGLVEDRGSLSVAPMKGTALSEAQWAKRAAYFCHWIDDDPNVQRPRQSRAFRIALTDEQPLSPGLVGAQHETYLAWLEDVFTRYPNLDEPSARVTRRLQWNAYDPALTGEVLLVAVALGRLRFLYGGLPKEAVALRLRLGTSNPHRRFDDPSPFAQRGVTCWTSSQANNRLLSYELDAMLAWLILHTAYSKLRKRRVAWRREPDRTVIAPAWRIVRSEGETTLLFRPPLGRATLDWLLAREQKNLIRFLALQDASRHVTRDDA
jgi:hypothetical protein